MNRQLKLKMNKLNDIIFRIYENFYIIILAISTWVTFAFLRIVKKILCYVSKKISQGVIEDFWDFVKHDVDSKFNSIDSKITKLESEIKVYRARAHNIRGEYYTLKEAIKKNDIEFLELIRSVYLKENEKSNER